MMRGRKPKPTHLRVISGNPGHRALNRLEPMPQGNLFDAPESLTENQRNLWNYAIANAPAGLLKHLDRGALEVYVCAWDTHTYANQQLAKFGMLLRAQSGELYQSPYYGMRKSSALVMIKQGSELGFSPASRPRIQLAPEEANPDDFDKLIGSA
jgi:P27 family predicted phage terminase small subunit